MADKTIVAGASPVARPGDGIDVYDGVTMALHWLTALLVLALFGTALTWNYVTPHDRFWRPLLEHTHVSLGILFAAVILVRIVWRLTGGRRLAREAGFSGFASSIMYGVLYVLLAAQAAGGFMLRWFQGEAFSFFGLFTVPALVGADKALSHQVEDIHNFIAWTIIILSLGHAAAALVHHYVLKDRVLGRMMPGRE